MVRNTKRRGKRVLVIDFSYADSDGKPQRFRRDAEVQTRAAAHAEERRRLAAVAAKGSPFALVDEAAAKAEAEQTAAPTGPTFSEVAKQYIAVYAPSKLKASTRYNYTNVVLNRLVPRFGMLPIEKVTGPEIAKFAAELAEAGMERATRRQILCVVRSVVCRFAVEADFLREPPKLAKLPRVGDKIPSTLSPEQRAAIVCAARRSEHRLAVLLSLHGGLRAGEVRGLRVEDVDLPRGMLTIRQSRWQDTVDVPKSGNDREVPLSDELKAELEKALDGRKRGEFVALSASGKPWGQCGLASLFYRLRARAKVEGFSFHQLRHSFVTALLDEGVGAHIVQELAGHARLGTTQRYAHATADRKREAIGRLNKAQSERSPSSGNSTVTAETAVPDAEDEGPKKA